jgi:RNA:NAD 2'-phosphotransferase (TPT1/KptA family)
VFVDAQKCANDRIQFYTSDNGVILTAGIDNKGTLPLRYFSHVMDAAGNVMLDNR